MRESQGIAILGSTGSIGRNTLDVVRHLDGSHRIVALAAGRNADGLMEQVREFRPAVASLADAPAAEAIREAAGRLGTRVLSGVEGATAVATAPGAELGRPALHAAVLGFRHPRDGRELRFEVPPPEDLAKVLEACTALGVE